VKNQLTTLSLTLLLLGLVLTACAAPSPTPTATPIPEPTATPLPATDTPAPQGEETTPPGGPDVALTHVDKPDEDVLATVNDEDVHWADYEPELQRNIYMVTQQYAVDWNDEANVALLPMLQEEVLRQTTARVLMRQLAEKEGISLTPEEIQVERDKQQETILGLGQYTTWEDFLEKNGLTDEYFHQLVVDNLLMEQLSDKHGPERQVEQAHVRHILVETEEEAQEVVDKLKAGGDFAVLAAEYSTDPGSKDQGGDLGWFPRGVMIKEFEDVAFSLPLEETSEPVQTQFGYHVLEVLERGPKDMDEQSYEQAKQQAFMDWFTEEHEAAVVVYVVHFVPEAELTPEPATTATPSS